MENRYKIIISNRNIYKEVEISPQIQEIRIGTSAECDERLRKDMFFGIIDIFLKKLNGEWYIFGSDNLYFTKDNNTRVFQKKLVHGDELFVKYKDSNNTLFKVSFIIDFDYEKKDYDLEIDIGTKNQITIGGLANCDIAIADNFLGSDTLSLIRKNRKLIIEDNNSHYGVFVNGIKISSRAEISDHDFFSIVGLSFYYKYGKLYTTSNPNMRINGLNFRKTLQHSTCYKYPKFNRNTRIQYVIPEEEIEIQQPVNKPQKSENSLLMSLIPAFVMLAMTIVLRGMMGNGGTFVIYSAVSMSMGIIMSIVAYFRDNKKFKKNWTKRIDEYNTYIDEKKKIISASRENELRIRNLIYESLDDSVNEVDSFGKRIFERSSEDVDFLNVYLGKGIVESLNPVKYTKQEIADLEDPLALIPETIYKNYRYIENAPIISDFNSSCAVGITGPSVFLEQMLKNITLDIAIRHFYNDVKMVYVLNRELVEKMQWVRWMHNVDNDKLGIRNIACDEESINIVLEDLYNILSHRESIAAQRENYKFNERYVVFIANAYLINSHPVSKYFKNANNYGFTFVFLDEYEERIPQGCTEIISFADKNTGTILKSENGDAVSSFTFPQIGDDVAESIALKLGGVCVDEVSLEGELTKNISMFEMLGILSVDDIDLKSRWANSVVYKSMAAPLGVKGKGEIVYLDIGDKGKAHGPHGLVAGTTGSGKSEILQTYILSMATLFHPYEVGFVIIDFKGGGMANQFEDLPHLIGTITNIDGREINRSLLSIKAELVKRQEMFAKSKVNHINDYIKLYKAGEVDVPMPHLIIIVDEFAELKSEYPDFMKELISAARIGRTLGIHLILATQKPAGVVDAQIWSNSKFKLCLKVQTKEDSNEVIKTPLAAEIVEPGRAYFQVGNNEIFELFQSAYSGANVPEGNEAEDKIYSIYERNIWGKKKLIYTNKKKKSSKKTDTQLEAIVKYVNEYCANSNIPKLPGICLPSLLDIINTDTLNYEQNEERKISVPVGIYDDPEQQYQAALDIELSKENTFIVGSSQSGKTVLLQTMIYGLINKYTPDEINLYLVDCGSMVLKIFENSAHVGGVVLSNDEEKCKNLFKMLNSTIVERKKVLSSKGIGNYASYIDAGYRDMPLMAVIIDNMAAFKEYFPDMADEILSLTREAQGVGISFVITSAATNALNYKAQANFSKKIALNCNDTGEYSSIFGHCRITPKENAGRGLCMIEKRILEFQTAIFGDTKNEGQRSEMLKEFIEDRNSQCTSKAVKIPMVPEKLVVEELMAVNPEAFRHKGIIPIGMDYSNVEIVNLDLAANNSLALMGDEDSKRVFVRNLLTIIGKTAIFHNIQAVIVDDKAETLKDFNQFGFVKEYSSNLLDSQDLVSDFCEDVMNRVDEKDDSILLLVLNSAEVYKKITSDKSRSKELAEAIKNATDAGAFAITVPVENQSVGFNASEVVKTIKESKNAILFDQLADSKMYDPPMRTKIDPSFNNSQGYYYNGRGFSKIKIFD